VAGCCEYGKEPSVSIKAGKFLTNAENKPHKIKLQHLMLLQSHELVRNCKGIL
jgi:hypothetical protein